MFILNSSEINCPSQTFIGEILLEAGLISSTQLKIALTFQRESSQELRLGDIIASKGWLKKETIDFLLKIASPSYKLKYTTGQPIGYYLLKAGLLSSEQINQILQEQKKLGLKFCYLAVLRGFIKAETADFFIKNVVDRVSVSTLQSSFNLDNKDDQVKTYLLGNDSCLQIENNVYEDIVKDQNILVFNNISQSKSNLNINNVEGDEQIECSPVWIDQ